MLQLLVAHVIESALSGKQSLFGDGGLGEQVLQALGQLCGALEGVDEQRGQHECEPLSRLLELGSCSMGNFAPGFSALCEAHAEVGMHVAEAILGKRQGLSKAEVKEAVERCKAATGEQQGTPPPRRLSSASVAWAPEELGPLSGAPFATAVRRLGGGKSLWAKVKVLKTTMHHTRPRQLSGSI